MIKLFLDIKPTPKQSTKFSNGRAYTPARLKKYVNDLKLLIKSQYKGDLLDTPIKIKRLHFYFEPTKTMLKSKKIRSELACFVIPVIVKPDLDNLCKPLFDAMEGVIFKGDQQIFGIDEIRKYYRNKQGILIEIEEDYEKRNL